LSRSIRAAGQSLRQLPRLGPNAVVRAALLDAHVFVYPSIYMETSCMAIQEAMMAGCLAITSNLGALPETCAEWAWMFSVDENFEVMAQRTYDNMQHALDHYHDDFTQQTLQNQSVYFQKFWSFETRLPHWQHLLDDVLVAGPKQEMLVFD
jgi:UDP-glucose:(glucosyl)LPS alpha-1,2-glucosyltransferase